MTRPGSKSSGSAAARRAIERHLNRTRIRAFLRRDARTAGAGQEQCGVPEREPRALQRLDLALIQGVNDTQEERGRPTWPAPLD